MFLLFIYLIPIYWTPGTCHALCLLWKTQPWARQEIFLLSRSLLCLVIMIKHNQTEGHFKVYNWAPKYIVKTWKLGGFHHVPGRPTSEQGGLELDLEEKKVFAKAERKLDMYFNVNIPQCDLKRSKHCLKKGVCSRKILWSSFLFHMHPPISGRLNFKAISNGALLQWNVTEYFWRNILRSPNHSKSRQIVYMPLAHIKLMLKMCKSVSK